MLETLLQPGDIDERCGLILKDGSIIELDNLAEDKTQGYRMDPHDVLARIEDITGTWHTHPETDPNLSGEDYSGFLAWPDLDHFIIGYRKGEVIVTRWRVQNELVISCD